jgi:hypothetical protein
MNIPGFSLSGLLMMHGSIKSALSIDDNTPPGAKATYGVRTYRDWKEHADAIEAELDSRKINYQKIEWY